MRAGAGSRSWAQALHGRRLQVRVDDRGAVYPVRVDPFVQQGELYASDGSALDEFGRSVAVSGDTIVVGAPARRRTHPGTIQEGVAYVFQKGAAGWKSAHQTASATPSDGGRLDHFGWSVAISGEDRSRRRRSGLTTAGKQRSSAAAAYVSRCRAGAGRTPPRHPS